MKLDTIIDNLKAVIANKKMFSEQLKLVQGIPKSPDSWLVNNVTVQFLEVNLTELNNMLDHLNALKQTQENKK